MDAFSNTFEQHCSNTYTHLNTFDAICESVLKCIEVEEYIF